ncbi:uncharacterized protein LOC119072989 [Bradysia coprophila]|uniref:uncharacterized protein LOC119072989 n=1 Tax=Bradysia coprophila TaxID=38358 RepID=UPI00187DAFBF|nr:uncharacterized protein LOC119072989 [Bradysia coprophila]
MVWILMCFVLQTVYQGQLFNFMRTNATVASVKTLDELIEKGISIKLVFDAYIDFFEYDYERLEKLLISENGTTAWEFVTETEAYVSMEIRLIDAVRREKPETRPKTIKIVLAPHVIDMPKRFYLKDAMDDLISYMNENGMTSKWTAPYTESAIRDNVDKRFPRKLNILQILGVVEVCLGALILSTLVFVFEVLSPRLGHW